MLVYQESAGGFVFTLKKGELDDAGGELPRGFINVSQRRGKWVFGSLELVSTCVWVRCGWNGELADGVDVGGSRRGTRG